MNAILYTGSKDSLTETELKYFKQAEKIIKNSQKDNKNKKEKKPKKDKKKKKNNHDENSNGNNGYSGNNNNNRNSNDNNNNQNSGKRNTIKIIIILAVIIALLLILFSTIFALINTKSDKITSNITILGIDVSNLTQDEATERINNELSERVTNDIVLKHGDENYILPPKQIEFEYDIKNVINEAYLIGRDGNIFENNFELIKQQFNKTNLSINVTYSDDLLQSIVPQMNENFSDRIKEANYEIDGTTLKISAPKDGYVVKYDELKQQIIQKLTAINYNTDPIEIPVEMQKAQAIDIEKIHNEIYKEPVDASYSTNPYKITASENGVDFKISVDEAKALITGDKEEYEIPLKVLYPKVTTSSISQEAFPDLLATYTTSYQTSSANRSNNIALAASKINGKVLMPGETFSYNSTVGKRTISAGFKEAGAYSNGKVTSEVGGGICQVSSTLYNSVLRANLEVTERTNHMFLVGYVPIGADATVSWGAPDFKFKNNRNYAIRLVAKTSGKRITISIYGLKQDDDYDIEILSYRTGTVPYRTTYTKDSSLTRGRTKVIQAGSNGATSVTYKIFKRNGREVSRELVSKDTYSPHNQVIAKGN